MKIAVFNGPNLNLLGTREPDIYGAVTLLDIENACIEKAKQNGAEAICRQTNSESELISWVQQSKESFDGIILNAAAFSHTSIALLDAIQAVGIPVIEVHLSNIFKRESFRHHSYVSGAASGVICGLGAKGYTLAVDALITILAQR